MSLIVSLVMTVLTQVMSAWDRSSDDLELSAKAIFRSDGSQWLSLTTEVPQDCPVSSANMTRLVFYSNPELRQTKDNAQGGSSGNIIPGDVCAVEYRVTFADPFGNADSTSKTFQLHRVVVDPATTFLGINGQPLMGISRSSGGLPTLEKTFDALVDKSIVPVESQVQLSQGKALNISVYGAGTTNSMLMDNVAQFKVFLYFYGGVPPNPNTGAASTGAPAIQVYPMTQYTAIDPPQYYYGGASFGGGPTNGYLDTEVFPSPDPSKPNFIALAYADVTITLLNQDGVAYIQSLNGQAPPDFNWQNFLQQFGKTYTHRIRFNNKPR